MRLPRRKPKEKISKSEQKEEPKTKKEAKKVEPEKEADTKKEEGTKENKYGTDLPILLVVIGFIIVLAKYWTGVALGLSGLITIIKMVRDNKYKTEDFQDTPGKKEKTIKEEAR